MDNEAVPDGGVPGGDAREEAADALARAARAYRRTEKAHQRARTDLKRAAVAALGAGVRQSDVSRTTGWTREYLRRLRKRDGSRAEG